MVELSAIVILGIFAQWIAWRFKFPAILPLILIGLFVGPFSTIFTADHQKLIDPTWNGDKGLFPSELLFNFVSLSISIILFEGGLTLRRSEFSNTGSVILKLISLGSIITFVGGGVASHYLFNISWSISFLFAALIIVTGPTVISPILRNIPLRKDISSVLKWEGILIDPIGALVAVLMFEFITIDAGGNLTFHAFADFLKVIVLGCSIGFFFGYLIYFIVKNNFIPHYLLNVFFLSSVLVVFVISNVLFAESGLLSVVIMGGVIGNTDLPNIKELLHFKASMTVLLISLLFILLSANMNLSDMYLLKNWETIYLFVIVVFVLRPIAVFICTYKSGLKLKEKLFISWVAPRGIVAAGIASLFGLKLEMNGNIDAGYLAPLVFMIVLGTVLLNATTARYIAKLLGVFLKKADGFLIVGASEMSLAIASYLRKNKKEVIVIDNNPNNIRRAKKQGLEAHVANIFSDDIFELTISNVSKVLALTPNANVNKVAIEMFKKQIGSEGYQFLIDEEKPNGKFLNIFSEKNTPIDIDRAFKKYPLINEMKVADATHLKKYLEKIESEKERIPIFLNDENLNIMMVSDFDKEENKGFDAKNFKLVFLGKPLEVQH